MMVQSAGESLGQFDELPGLWPADLRFLSMMDDLMTNVGPVIQALCCVVVAFRGEMVPKVGGPEVHSLQNCSHRLGSMMAYMVEEVVRHCISDVLDPRGLRSQERHFET